MSEIASSPDGLAPVFAGNGVTVFHGDCLDVLRTLPAHSIDAVVTDPPYGISISGGEHWDDFGRQRERVERGGHKNSGILPGSGRGGRAEEVAAYRRRSNAAFEEWVLLWAEECFRVLKPGGHLLAFGSSRTAHRLAAGIEDAGFEIRDGINWVYTSGFSKSMNVSKVLDKSAGRRDQSIDDLKDLLAETLKASGITKAEWNRRCGFNASGYLAKFKEGQKLNPWVWTLPTADRWRVMKGALGLDPDETDGVAGQLDAFFTAAERTVVGRGKSGLTAGNITTFGSPSREFDVTVAASELAKQWEGWGTALKPSYEPIVVARKPLVVSVANNIGLHGVGPINVDATRVPWVKGLPKSGGSTVHPGGKWPTNTVLSHSSACDEATGCVEGCAVDDASAQLPGTAEEYFPVFRYEPKAKTSERPVSEDGSYHPSVKPLALMRWLVRLVTPPDGVVLDPFAGSGTTAEACVLEGMQCVTIEREEAYLPLIEARLSKPIAPVLGFEV